MTATLINLIVVIFSQSFHNIISLQNFHIFLPLLLSANNLPYYYTGKLKIKIKFPPIYQSSYISPLLLRWKNLSLPVRNKILHLSWGMASHLLGDSTPLFTGPFALWVFLLLTHHHHLMALLSSMLKKNNPFIQYPLSSTPHLSTTQ